MDYSKYTFKERLLIAKRKYYYKIMPLILRKIYRKDLGYINDLDITDVNSVLILYQYIYSSKEKYFMYKMFRTQSSKVSGYYNRMIRCTTFISKAEIDDLKLILPELFNRHIYCRTKVDKYTVLSQDKDSEKEIKQYLKDKPCYVINKRFIPKPYGLNYRELAQEAGIYFPKEFTENEIKQYVEIMLKE